MARRRGFGSSVLGQNGVNHALPLRPSDFQTCRAEFLNNIGEGMGSIGGQAATRCARSRLKPDFSHVRLKCGRTFFSCYLAASAAHQPSQESSGVHIINVVFRWASMSLSAGTADERIPVSLPASLAYMNSLCTHSKARLNGPFSWKCRWGGLTGPVSICSSISFSFLLSGGGPPSAHAMGP
eukprot:1161913-Pelagomonas_calceolata.AAC.8